VRAAAAAVGERLAVLKARIVDGAPAADWPVSRHTRRERLTSNMSSVTEDGISVTASPFASEPVGGRMR
jgi:hypothetical protein